MTKIAYAGRERRPRAEPVRKLDPRPENQSVKYLRQLRAWVSGTHDVTRAGVVDKIDDLLFQARGGK